MDAADPMTLSPGKKISRKNDLRRSTTIWSPERTRRAAADASGSSKLMKNSR
jgi:hypothetical protein